MQYKSHIIRIILLSVLLFGGVGAYAQTQPEVVRRGIWDYRTYFDDEDTFRNDMEHPEKPVWQDKNAELDFTNSSLDYDWLMGQWRISNINGAERWPEGSNPKMRYLRNRRALVGRTCALNKLITTVNVAQGMSNMGAIMDEDLNNFASVGTGINADLGAGPILSVRDLENYYAKGTVAGFCILTGDNSLLNLNVISMFSIGFYRDGHLINSITVREGQSASGLGLGLITLPGTQNTAIMLTAVAPEVFDEISLETVGAVSASVATAINVRYAFVGDSREYPMVFDEKGNDNQTITYRNYGDYKETNFMSRYNADLTEAEKRKGANEVAHKSHGVWQPFPVLAAVPIKFAEKEAFDLVNNDTTDRSATVIPGIVIGFQGRAQVMTKPKGGAKGETFPAGVDVGFKIEFGGAVNLDVGDWATFFLLDANGNTVQEDRVQGEVLGLALGSGGAKTIVVNAQTPFSGIKVEYNTVVGVDLSGMTFFYGFVRKGPEIIHHCDLNPSANVSTADCNDTFQLTANPNIPVRWTIECIDKDDPDPKYDRIRNEYLANHEDADPTAVTVDDNGYVQGLVPYYTYKVTCYSMIDDCYEIIYLKPGMFAYKQNGDPMKDEGGNPIVDEHGNMKYEEIIHCGQPLVYPEYVKSEKVPAGTSGGGIVTIDNLKYEERITNMRPPVDANPDDYDYDIYSYNYDSYDDFAIYEAGLSLASNVTITGVKTADPSKYIWNPDDPRWRTEGGGYHAFKVGFVVEFKNTALDANVLDFFRVLCYDNNTPAKVYTGVCDEATAISVGLVGDDTMTKVKLSFTLSAEKIAEELAENDLAAFNEIILWSSGVLNLNISTVNIFYAFIENADPDGPCANPLLCDGTPIDQNHGAYINAEETKYNGAVSLGDVTDNLSFIVDDDPELKTCCTVSAPVSALNQTIISVKTGRTADHRQLLGIAVDDKTYTAIIKVTSVMQVALYHNGVATGDVQSDWGVADIDLIGAGSRHYVYMHPTKPFDEVRILIWHTVTALDFFNIYGLVLRSDADGDGIPDCEDPTPQIDCGVETEIYDIPDICAGEKLSISGYVAKTDTDYIFYTGLKNPKKENFAEVLQNVVEGDTEADKANKTRIKLREIKDTRIKYDGDGNPIPIPGTEDYETEEYVKDVAVVINVQSDRASEAERADSKFNFAFQYTTEATDAGQYISTITDPLGVQLASKKYLVHPLLTTWLGKIDDNWKRWENWSDGTPYCCTNVIIPTTAPVYPNLDLDAAKLLAANADYYCCKGIHFEPGGNIYAVTKLNYERAWVERFMAPNKWNLFSAPLHNMYTGDMYVPESMMGVHQNLNQDNEDVYFEDLTTTNSPENRFNPTIYQRRWDKAVAVQLIGNDKEETLTSAEGLMWSRLFNHLSYNYGFGEGVSVWVDNGNLDENTTFRFRFPKNIGKYNYYSDFGDHDRFDDIYEGGDGDKALKRDLLNRFIYEDKTREDVINFTYKTENDRQVYKSFLPMTLQLTLTDDRYTGTDDALFLFGNPLMANINVEKFLEGNGHVTAVSFMADETDRSVVYDLSTGTLVKSGDAPDFIAPMTAVFLKVSGNAKTRTFRITEEMINPDLFGDAISSPQESLLPRVEIRATANDVTASAVALEGEACNDMTHALLVDGDQRPVVALWGLAQDGVCNIFPTQESVDLGLYLREKADVTITFFARDNFDREAYELFDAETGIAYPLCETVAIKDATSSVGRFSLRKTMAHNAEDALEEITAKPYLEINGNELTVKTVDCETEQISAYALDGSLMKRSAGNRITLADGIYIIVAALDNGETAKFKVIVK